MNLFSSPGKQASQAAAATGAISQQEIQQLQQYDQQNQQNLRNAITGMGPNPYFEAGSMLSPSNYQINPADTVGFGSSGPGTTSVRAGNPVQANPYPVPSSPSTNPTPKPGQNPPPSNGGAPVAPAPPKTQPPGAPGQQPPGGGGGPIGRTPLPPRGYGTGAPL